MKVRLLAEADAEAKEAACWYDGRQAGLGEEFLAALAKRLQEIEDRPGRFSRLETIKTKREIHRTILRRFPYSVVYEILSDEVIVLAVAHTSRRPKYWIKRQG
jgi:toxin ParE1/3/4